jgi:hypothetical protein
MPTTDVKGRIVCCIVQQDILHMKDFTHNTTVLFNELATCSHHQADTKNSKELNNLVAVLFGDLRPYTYVI